jgi:hypothetical protein
MANLIQSTKEDKALQEVKRAINSHNDFRHTFNYDLIKPYSKFWEEISITKEGILLRDDRILLPQGLEKIIIDYAHDGHLGMTLVKRLLRNICWFPGMDTKIELKVSNCIACEANTDNTTTEPIIPTRMPLDNWKTLAMDWSSKTPSNEYILVVYDEQGRKMVLHLSSSTTAKAAINVSKRIFTTMGIPNSIKTDNGLSCQGMG